MNVAMSRRRTEADIEKALAYIPAHDYQTWIHMGMAIKAELGEEGFPVWDDWSRTAHNYKERQVMAKWQSFRREGGITVGTLFHEAGRYGFTLADDHRTDLRVSSGESPRYEDRSANMKRDADHARAATIAQAMWDTARPAPQDHPYLVSKGVAPHNLRIDRDGNLVVPLSIGGHLKSLQFISPDGTKRFLAGGRKSGCHFSLGQATSTSMLCICEGYATGASIYEATGFPVAVALDAGNLGPVARVLREAYPTAIIVVCSDNDICEKGAPNTGLLAATTAAESINGIIAVPEMDGQKCDYNDLRQGRGGDAVAESIAEACRRARAKPFPRVEYESDPCRSDQWPEPLPIMKRIDAEEYPLDALPGIIRAAVEEVQKFTKAPTPMVASCAIAAVSLAAQSRIEVSRADMLIGPVGLFFLTIADSGERKSTCDGFFSSPIKEYDRQQEEIAKHGRRRHAAALKSWEARIEGVLTGIRQAAKKGVPSDDLQCRLADLEEQKPTPAKVPKLMRGDDTPENLIFVLSHEWPSVGVLTAEAGMILGSHGMGKDSMMRNLTLLNTLWDGGTHAVGRRTSASSPATKARLTLSLQVQAPTLRSFFARTDGLARGTGFLARFLLAWPESTQGYRPFSDPPSDWPFLEAFKHRLTEILHLPIPFDETGALSPMVLSLTSEAKAAWVEFHDSIEVQLRVGGELQDVRDVASKIADNAVRLAALFHMMCSNCSSSSIEVDHIVSGCRIAAWHLNESRRFFGELSVPPEMSAVARLEAWLINECRQKRTNRVPIRQVQQRGPGSLRDRTILDAALRDLLDHGRVRLIEEGKCKNIQINPCLLSGGDE